MGLIQIASTPEPHRLVEVGPGTLVALHELQQWVLARTTVEELGEGEALQRDAFHRHGLQSGQLSPCPLVFVVVGHALHVVRDDIVTRVEDFFANAKESALPALRVPMWKTEATSGVGF